MSGQLSMFSPATLPDTPSATGLPELAAGASPCASPDGLTTGPSGPGAAPVSPSRQRGARLGATIRATFGRRGFASSKSAALQSSLESKWRQRLGTGGSTLFSQTWKRLTTPAGRSLLAHTASGHRTSGNGCGLSLKGWTTPCVADDNMSRRSDASMDRYAQRDKPNASVAREVKLIQASRPSPKATNGTGASETETRQGGADLQTVALASWPTPNSQENDMSPEKWARLSVKQKAANPKLGEKQKMLSTVAQLASWPTPSTIEPDGPPRPSRAATGRTTEYLGRTVQLTSWPTPNAGPQNDTDTTWEARRESLKAQHKNGNGFGLTLGMASQLSAWPTPNTPSGGRSVSIETMDATGRTLDGKKHTASLEHAVKFASWLTPTAQDNDQVAGEYATNGTTLGGASRLSSWATPNAADAKNCGGTGTSNHKTLPGDLLTLGPILSGSPAATAKPGQLNPAFSRWLMGYPPEWDDCAGTAMPSSRKSQPK